jgi:hypothetical protein
VTFRPWPLEADFYFTSYGAATVHIGRRERETIWGLFAFALTVNLAGYLFNLYERLSWFDKFLHFYIPLALTPALGLRLYSRGRAETREHTFILALTVACVGIAAGTFWEIAE